MAFDTDRLVTFGIDAIEKFAAAHPDETFYGFAIDADLLCLNSIEEFSKTLQSYQDSDGEMYRDKGAIDDLKYSTGDWEYQGFARLSDSGGFDAVEYDEHYNMGLDDAEDLGLPTTAYALAMNEVLERLKASGVFEKLKRTPDFEVARVEHNS